MKDTFALITGASSGIGLEISKSLAKRNHNLVLTARRESVLEEEAKKLRNTFGVKVDFFPCDLTDEKAPQALYDFLTKRVTWLIFWSTMRVMLSLLLLIKPQ